MPFEPGQSGNPNGRIAGTANKATTKSRQAIAEFIEGNVERLNGWLDAIAENDPKDAFNCFMSVIEYHVPKLARVDHGNADGKSFKVEWPVGKSPLDE